MSAGKGRGPMKGYNWQKYADNYDQVFRKPTKPKRLKTMKTNQDGKLPAPVLAWHREAARRANLVHSNGDWSETDNPDTLIAAIIAAHDPHATTVRLLERAIGNLTLWNDSDPKGTAHFVPETIAAIRAHLATLQQSEKQEGTR